MTNYLETNEKLLENISKEIEVTKKIKMGIMDRKNIIIKLENVSDGLSSTLEMSENRISELEHKSIEFILSEQQRENRLKKIL